MAGKTITDGLRGVPTEVKAAIAKQLVGGSLEELGKVRVFPKGIPRPDQWVISVLPNSKTNAKTIVDALSARAGHWQFEVFPYGIINPEIGRIDIGVPSGK